MNTSAAAIRAALDLSAQWDAAAAALARWDWPGFDREMVTFREMHDDITRERGDGNALPSIR